MAAIFAARGGADVRLLERTRDGGRKILISGGGRCNILPARVDESRFVTDSSPHTLRKIVRSWPLREQIAFFERDAGLPLVEEPESAKLFPRSQSARDVRDRLYALAQQHGVAIQMNANVVGLAPAGAGWRVKIDNADDVLADSVIVATGGLSVPQTGSDGRGLGIVESLGHAVHSTYPALTPLIAMPAPFAQLSGVSLGVTISARTNRFDSGGQRIAHGRQATATGGFLFTHRGYSGPAVLDVSHVAVRSLADNGAPARVTVKWTSRGDAAWADALKAHGSRTVLAAVASEMPSRLAEALIVSAGVEPGQVLAHLSRRDRLRLIDTFVRGDLPWTGDEGYKKAEVTGGGVSLAEVDPRTLESRRYKGLFLCGEMLDAFGPIGGYNFLWAWATGRAAGLGAAARSVPG